MTGRPTDWDVLDLDRDPVPGDPFEVKELARKLGDFADDVASALRSVRGLSGDSVVQEWAGLSGDAYRQQFGDLPGELDKLERSFGDLEMTEEVYEQIAGRLEVLKSKWGALRDTAAGPERGGQEKEEKFDFESASDEEVFGLLDELGLSD